jgi:hypothetical protein
MQLRSTVSKRSVASYPKIKSHLLMQFSASRHTQIGQILSFSSTLATVWLSETSLIQMIDLLHQGMLSYTMCPCRILHLKRIKDSTRRKPRVSMWILHRAVGPKAQHSTYVLSIYIIPMMVLRAWHR